MTGNGLDDDDNDYDWWWSFQWLVTNYSWWWWLAIALMMIMITIWWWSFWRVMTASMMILQAKQKVDRKQLSLQNLLYELMHLQREISKCVQFKSVHAFVTEVISINHSSYHHTPNYLFVTSSWILITYNSITGQCLHRTFVIFECSRDLCRCDNLCGR